MVYLPIADVTAVVCVPSSRIVTSEIGSPPTVVTVPVIVICWPNALPLRAIENRRLNATARRPGNTRLLRDCLSGDFLSIVILQWRTRSISWSVAGRQALLVKAGETVMSGRSRPFGLAEAWRGAAADPS